MVTNDDGDAGNLVLPGRAVTPRGFGYRKVRYAVGLVDDAMRGPLAKGVPDGRTIVVQPVG
jgi:hypothetical protein